MNHLVELSNVQDSNVNRRDGAMTDLVFFWLLCSY